MREEIVNPLRKNLFVRADRVMRLRELLEKLSSVTGLTCEEKDPEEFLNSLLTQIMRAEPFLKVINNTIQMTSSTTSSNAINFTFLLSRLQQLSSGQDAFYYQLFVEKDERLSFPTVQQLFEQSFLASDIKLKEVPSCLIIQMPRFGKNFKMYPRILPSQVLDVTDIIEGCTYWFISMLNTFQSLIYSNTEYLIFSTATMLRLWKIGRTGMQRMLWIDTIWCWTGKHQFLQAMFGQSAFTR